jgi:hypothetical protein
MKLAQDLVAKKCGIFKENESLDDMTLKHFLEMLKDRRGDQRGGEWEPIKIPYEIWPISQNRPKSATYAISLQDQEHMLREMKNY